MRSEPARRRGGGGGSGIPAGLRQALPETRWEELGERERPRVEGWLPPCAPPLYYIGWRGRGAALQVPPRVGGSQGEGVPSKSKWSAYPPFLGI